MRLILNGDDFGFSRGVNAAMIDCYKIGAMKSCSLMVNMPGAKEAAQLMKENPGLSVGIHFTLTVGRPLTQNKTLIKEDGSFNKGMLRESSHVDQEEIRTELQAQFDRFVELTGQLPAHLNSHHGIELIKGAEEVVCELANKYDLPIRRFFTLPEGNHPLTNYEVAKMVGIPMEKVEKTGQDLINCFTKEDLESDDIIEFAAHPGYVDVETMQVSSLTIGRAYDAYVFLDPKVLKWIEDNHIVNTDYTALKKIK